jgi:ATP-binding cassette, subfamily B, bacterial
LSVPAGATIGIVGATGSGKSTLVKLLLRFYEVQSGRILIDGIDIRELNLFDLRQCIGWVSQDVFLFHGTVAENIRYGSFDATHEQIVEAAKLAEAHEFIQQLPQGYDTIVGERGQKLSGGQRQRLAIARAILKDPPILILDEATSAVDNETEAAIQKSLTRITQNRTTIAIAHRLSTIRHANCIYVMDKGQIVEQGTHEELLFLNGVYAGLWNVQSGMVLPEADYNS